jgi:hypothetical protein
MCSHLPRLASTQGAEAVHSQCTPLAEALERQPTAHSTAHARPRRRPARPDAASPSPDCSRARVPTSPHSSFTLGKLLPVTEGHAPAQASPAQPRPPFLQLLTLASLVATKEGGGKTARHVKAWFTEVLVFHFPLRSKRRGLSQYRRNAVGPSEASARSEHCAAYTPLLEGRGLTSFPVQLNLSSSVHSITQLNSGMCPGVARVEL